MASLTTTKCDKAFKIKRWLVLILPHISITPFVIMIRVVPLAPMNAALNYFPISLDMFRAAALQLFQLPFMVAVVTGMYSIILPINLVLASELFGGLCRFLSCGGKRHRNETCSNLVVMGRMSVKPRQGNALLDYWVIIVNQIADPTFLTCISKPALP